jgi:invasion protein IalB
MAPAQRCERRAAQAGRKGLIRVTPFKLRRKNALRAAPATRPRNTSRARFAPLAALAAFALLCTAGGPAEAQKDKAPQTYGTWRVHCGKPPGKREENCSLVNDALAADRENFGLKIVIFHTTDKKQWVLKVVAPIGVLLPFGVGINIDGAVLDSVPFVQCSAAAGRVGCVAQAFLEQKQVDQFAAGKQVVFYVFDRPDMAIGIPVSLNGFKAGLARIK